MRMHHCAGIAATVWLSHLALAGAPVVAVLVEQLPDSPGGLVRSATDQRVADDFTSPLTTRMTGLTWWGAEGSGESGDWLIEIYADNGQGHVGVSLHEEVISDSMVLQAPVGSRSVWTAELSAEVPLIAGGSYWLSVYRFGGSGAFVWTSSDDGDGRFATASFPNFADTYQPAGVFDVAWQVRVPAPGAGAVLLAAGVLSLRRRRA